MLTCAHLNMLSRSIATGARSLLFPQAAVGANNTASAGASLLSGVTATTPVPSAGLREMLDGCLADGNRGAGK